MNLFFFILSLVSIAFTINVIRPLYQHPKWIVPSFLFGWLVGELAIHIVLAQLFMMSWFIFFGVVKGFWGATGVVLFFSSWMMLAYHYFSGYKAKVLMDRIVMPHRKKEDLSSWSRHVELDMTRLLLPFSSWKSDEVKTIKNVVYQEVDGFHLKLDIRHNKNIGRNAPVLLQIHGGAWTHGYGSKNEQGVPLMVEMAKRGWVSISIDYRLCPAATFPEHIIDCKRALVWVKEHIREYGGNPDYIVVTGGSAGGHLSSLLALSANRPAFQPGFEDKDTTVQGCIPFYGIYDLLDQQKLQRSLGLDIILSKKIIRQTKKENEALYRLMSPVTHVNKDAPPFLVIHGDKDSLTSLGEAQYFASLLDESSTQTVEFAEITGAQHAFDIFSSVRSDYVLFGVAERMCQWHRDFEGKLSSES